MYPRVVTFELNAILENRNFRKSGVNGLFVNQLLKGWKIISVHPYEYFSHLAISS
jgi:hypothetical protein